MPACTTRSFNPIRFGLVLAVLTLTCAGCGRRGALEPPDGPVVERSSGSQGPASARVLPQDIGVGGGGAAPDPDAVRDGDEVPASATVPGLDSSPLATSRGAKRGYTIPKRPFILDPIL